MVRLVHKHHPNLVITDVSMPDMNGIEATRKIIEEIPGVRVIALSMHSDRRFVLGMLEAGAHGYLLKDTAFEELATAIWKVAGGNTYLSLWIAEVVVKGYLNKTPGSSRASFNQYTRSKSILIVYYISAYKRPFSINVL